VLRLFSSLAGVGEAGPLLPSSVRIVRNALQALVPGADPSASSQAAEALDVGMSLLHEALEECSPDIVGDGSFLAVPAVADSTLDPPPKWQTDTLDLAIHALELMGEPRCQSAALWATIRAMCTAFPPVHHDRGPGRLCMYSFLQCCVESLVIPGGVCFSR
jgi:hypothetical protein